jgi:hypothetical protein
MRNKITHQSTSYIDKSSNNIFRVENENFVKKN